MLTCLGGLGLGDPARRVSGMGESHRVWGVEGCGLGVWVIGGSCHALCIVEPLLNPGLGDICRVFFRDVIVESCD